MEKTIIIGITVSETNYVNYPKWFLEDSQHVKILELSANKQNQAELLQCHGLLLTGGVDIDPYFYQPENTNYPNKPSSWNRERDQFEMDLFAAAQKLRMPILGICRGLQLVNVALNGTLVPDIAEAGKQNHRSIAGIDHMHAVEVVSGSLLEKITAANSGIVNSAHHQSIDKVADALQVNCTAAEGIIEGIEWKQKENKSPLLCVQWHPERIENKNTNPLSKNILHWFLNEAVNYNV